MKNLIICFLVFISGFGLYAQNLPFELDASFQPDLNFRDANTIFLPNGEYYYQRAGSIMDIWEVSNTGKVYAVGDFILVNDSDQYHGHISMFNNGSLYGAFKFPFIGGSRGLFPINDSTFISMSNHSRGYLIDTLGNVNMDWQSNFQNLVVCANSGMPFFFEDGSSLWTGHGCTIIAPPDTFYNRFIIKVNPNGSFDSSFIVDADVSYANFTRYDSNRILMYAPPRFIYSYGKYKVNGIWRIFLDGTLDTAFHAPISDAWANGSFELTVEDEDKILVSGYFLLNADTTYRTLIRLNKNGSLDSTFMNSSGPLDTSLIGESVTAIAPTEDGGYLVGGIFNEYQGYKRNGIAKINKYGAVDPQYFNGKGVDSAFIGRPYISKILSSAFGGYYVIGNFRDWNGQPTGPIIRLHGLNVGLEEQERQVQKLKVFPNPAKESIRFYGIGSSKIENLLLIDVQGKTLEADFWETSSNTYETNTSKLKPGMYFLKVVSEGEVAVGKFVKH